MEDGDIILLHDLYETSIYGAIDAMDELKTKGYEFVTVSELAKIKNQKLVTGKSYFYFK